MIGSPVQRTRNRQDPTLHRRGVQATRRGSRVAFATATEWVVRRSEAKRAGKAH